MLDIQLFILFILFILFMYIFPSPKVPGGAKEGVLSGCERVLAGVTAALVTWEKAKVRRVTLAITHLRKTLTHLSTDTHLSKPANEFQVCNELVYVMAFELI